MKKCTKCKRELDISCFSKSKRRQDGLHNKCKECMAIYLKEYRENNKDKIRDKKHQHYVNNVLSIKEYQKSWREDNQESIKLRRNKVQDAAYHKNFRRTIKLEIINYYGGKCTCCGETTIEFLTIDHINGGGNKHRKELSGSARRGGINFYKWLKKNKYPSEYQVLCWNCNCSKGAFGYCPHQQTSQQGVENG